MFTHPLSGDLFAWTIFTSSFRPEVSAPPPLSRSLKLPFKDSLGSGWYSIFKEPLQSIVKSSIIAHPRNVNKYLKSLHFPLTIAIQKRPKIVNGKLSLKEKCHAITIGSWKKEK